MADYNKYMNALRKCAKEHDNDLCRDTANLLEKLEQEDCVMLEQAEVKAYFNGQSYGWDEGRKDVLNKIRVEIEKQEKWLMSAGYNAYNVDIAFSSIKLVLAESEGEK